MNKLNNKSLTGTNRRQKHLGTKTCNKCTTTKALDDFHNKGGGRKASTCKECFNQHKRNTSKNRPRNFKKYNYSLSAYNLQYTKQGGKCSICTQEFETLSVDHNHTTGEFRGLLCSKCNMGIGLLGDSVVNIDQASLYLTITGQYGKE